MMADTKQTDFSVSFYSRPILSIYHYIILFNFTYMWKCSLMSVVFPFFSENFSENHLDCGVADGYFPLSTLQRPYRDQKKQRLTLLDANANALQVAKAHVLSGSPATEIRTIEADVTAPLVQELKGVKFDSISMFNLFHCIPGGSGKWRAFGIFKEVLSDDGVLTGCTVLGERHAPSSLPWWYNALYNRIGIFHNWDDTKSDVESALKKEFAEVDTWLVGMTLLFKARKPRKA
ncbi:methyltransferase [Hypoxylon trugodes]|uniref:methyltransferase n=1 Tax=Hypoxylon trugodes TaxID=326681 RepID=UPI002190F273|nr:methyltransferase [Hypoxylon trugodes]KAI1392729.1 methyltransferase [Hypoxylon trugodes]